MTRQITKSNFIKLKSLSRRYTPLELMNKIREKLSSPYRDYPKTCQRYLPTQDELEAQRQKTFACRPLISIVVPAYETPAEFLYQMVDSCIAQTYSNWELCIADGSRTSRVEDAIAGRYETETRIKYKRLEQNGGISENTNQGFAMAKGDYIALLDHDDLLVPSALYEMTACICKTGADFLYSDEDKVTENLRTCMEPHFKLDFNRELLLGNNYICHFLMVSAEVLCQAGGMDSRYDGAQDYDFVLRCSECAKEIRHIPKILYHWRVHSGSTAGNTDSKLYAYEAGKRALEAYLKRQKWNGQVSQRKDLGFYRIRYQVPGKLRIGVWLWGAEKTGKGEEEIRNYIRQELIPYQAEIIWDYDFIQDADRADYILIFNKEIQRIERESIAILLGSCARNGVGIAAARTVTRKSVVQCGYRKTAAGFSPRFAGLPREFKGYFRRAVLPVETDAVGNDLAVIDRSIAKVIRESGARPNNKSRWFEICEKTKAAGSRIVADPSAEVRISGN